MPRRTAFARQARVGVGTFQPAREFEVFFVGWCGRTFQPLLKQGSLQVRKDPCSAHIKFLASRSICAESVEWMSKNVVCCLLINLVDVRSPDSKAPGSMTRNVGPTSFQNQRTSKLNKLLPTKNLLVTCCQEKHRKTSLSTIQAGLLLRKSMKNQSRKSKWFLGRLPFPRSPSGSNKARATLSICTPSLLHIAHKRPRWMAHSVAGPCDRHFVTCFVVGGSWKIRLRSWQNLAIVPLSRG